MNVRWIIILVALLFSTVSSQYFLHGSIEREREWQQIVKDSQALAHRWKSLYQETRAVCGPALKDIEIYDFQPLKPED